MLKETNVTIENLTPHTKYEFGVQTVLANHDYVRPGVFLTAATDELTDLSPNNLTALVLNPNTIRFSWKPPRLQPDKATLYYLLQNGTRRNWTSGTSVELQGFSPHSTYEFCLRKLLSNSVLVEPGACVTANTDEITNLNPRELSAAVRDTNSIELAWKPPRTQAWESLIYEIRVNGQFNQITGNTHVTIYDLTPSFKYKFRVQTVNTNYEVVSPGISVTETTPNQADLNPSELNALVLNLTYVQLSWKQPNVSITSQELFCIFQNGIPRRITARRKVNITGLTPHTKYVFGVQTVHSNGDYIAPGVNVTVSTDDLRTAYLKASIDNTIASVPPYQQV
ncbi:maintenance of animal organ identity [Sparganum proliferum]